jgi:hypothetical protein
MIRQATGVALVAAAATALLAGGASMVGQPHGPAGGPTYSVAQVMAGSAQRPLQWIGRTVRVRGVLGPVLCPSRICRWPSNPPAIGLAQALLHSGGLVELYDPAAGAGPVTATLLLRLSYRPSWLGELRGVPLLRPLIPPAQAVDWAAPAIYRVRLEEDWTGRCCEGVVPDAQP